MEMIAQGRFYGIAYNPESDEYENVALRQAGNPNPVTVESFFELEDAVKSATASEVKQCGKKSKIHVIPSGNDDVDLNLQRILLAEFFEQTGEMVLAKLVRASD